MSHPLSQQQFSTLLAAYSKEPVERALATQPSLFTTEPSLDTPPSQQPPRKRPTR